MRSFLGFSSKLKWVVFKIMKPMKVGICLLAINTFNPKEKVSVWGDELIARGWQKYLQAEEEIEAVYLSGSGGLSETDIDVLIHFHPNLELHPKAKNILYHQNAYHPEEYPGGTVGIFAQARERQNFDGYIFPSEKLMKACTSGAVVPFATDPEFFKPESAEGKFAHPVSFVGNGIRNNQVNQRYFSPAVPFGLVIYGLSRWVPPLDTVCRGKLPMPDLPKVYTESLINLNAHLTPHAEWGTMNLRIFDILACGGFILSDYVDTLEETFGEAIAYTDGYEDSWAKLVEYLANEEERKRRSQEGQKLVLSNHTYAQRMKTVKAYLQQIL